MSRVTKHTPTPWELGPVRRECDGHAVYFSEQREVYPPSAGPGEEQHGGPIAVFSVAECGESNIALFIASPKMLAALEAFERFYETDYPGVTYLEAFKALRAQVRAAIAAAEPNGSK